MSDSLDRIEAVAEAADADGRPWEWEHAYPQRITRVGDVVLVAECFEDPDAPSRFAEFIATCDPPTVLALVKVARAAGPLFTLAAVAHEGDPWYAEHEGLDPEEILAAAREALAVLHDEGTAPEEQT